MKMPAQIERTAPVELQWIDEPEDQLRKPPLNEFELVGPRSLSEFILTKVGNNLFVPVGLIATATCLTMGIVNLHRGNKEKQQFFMRGRVGFQAFTIVAMTLGTYLTGRSRNNSETRKES